MRRMPIYFLIDVSESMVGDPINQVQDEINTIIQELQRNPFMLEYAFVSIIAYNDTAQTLSPLTELSHFEFPSLSIGGGTSLSECLNHYMNEMDVNIQKTTMEVKGDRKPIIFLFTNGRSTRIADTVIERWNQKYRRRCYLNVILADDCEDTIVYQELTKKILRLNNDEVKSLTDDIVRHFPGDWENYYGETLYW